MLFAFVLSWIPSADACLWDDDTYAVEQRGLPEVVEVLTGHFDRFPPEYYARRLEIAQAVLAANPDDLDAYDNAAVAHDRLGRSAEALALMEGKQAALARLGRPDDPEHRQHQYRLLANQGTFYAHAAIREDPHLASPDLDRAIEKIEAAIALNPEAHFGRETIQLQALQWLRHAPPLRTPDEFWSQTGILGIEDWFGLTIRAVNSQQIVPGLDDAIEGLTGLIVLGAAWESVDIHIELSRALYASGQSSLGWMARLRARQLVEEGALPLQRMMFSMSDLERSLQEEATQITRDAAQTEQAFRTGTEAASAWRAARNRWVLTQLEAGRHPDTHPDFWDGAP